MSPRLRQHVARRTAVKAAARWWRHYAGLIRACTPRVTPFSRGV